MQKANCHDNCSTTTNQRYEATEPAVEGLYGCGKPYLTEGSFRAAFGGKHLCAEFVYWANVGGKHLFAEFVYWARRSWAAGAKGARPLCLTSSRRRSA